MRNVSFTAVLGIAAVALSACSKNLQDFVHVDPRLVSPLPLTNSGSGQTGVKFSPGATTSAGGDLIMTATITPSRTRLSSGDLVMEVGTSRSSTTR